MSFEGRFDSTEPLQTHLHNLYQLRQQAGAEEWPMPSEPLIDEDGVPVKLMVIPSKANLLKHAQPLDRMHLNKNIRTLVVDRAIKKEFEKAVSERLVPFCDQVVFEFTEHASGVLIALDGSDQFCGSYNLPGGAHQPSPTAPPAGCEVTVALHEIAAIGVSILFSTWIAARFLALSISN